MPAGPAPRSRQHQRPTSPRSHPQMTRSPLFVELSPGTAAARTRAAAARATRTRQGGIELAHCCSPDVIASRTTASHRGGAARALNVRSQRVAVVGSRLVCERRWFGARGATCPGKASRRSAGPPERSCQLRVALSGGRLLSFLLGRTSRFGFVLLTLARASVHG